MIGGPQKLFNMATSLRVMSEAFITSDMLAEDNITNSCNEVVNCNPVATMHV